MLKLEGILIKDLRLYVLRSLLLNLVELLLDLGITADKTLQIRTLSLSFVTEIVDGEGITAEDVYGFAQVHRRPDCLSPYLGSVVSQLEFGTLL